MNQRKRTAGAFVCLAALFGAMALFAAVTSLPPIPITVTLSKACFATVVLDDVSGKRVANLASNEWFPAGTSTLYWDGTRYGGLSPTADSVWIKTLCTPGTYTVNVLTRDSVHLRYEFGVGSGNPPWITSLTRSGGWLADHAAPSGIAFLPKESRVAVCAPGAEWGDDHMELDLAGTKLTGGRYVYGQVWCGGDFVTADPGPSATGARYYGVHGRGSMLYVYKMATANSTTGSMLTGTYPIKMKTAWEPYLFGVAAYNNLVVVSMIKSDGTPTLRLYGAQSGDVAMDNVGPVAMDKTGKLYMVCGTELRRYNSISLTGVTGLTVLATTLSDPQGITVDTLGNIYVSQWGNLHQVVKYSAAGAVVRSFGAGGKPVSGQYNPNAIFNPKGIAIDNQMRLWVAESNFRPKRISVWNSDGTLAFAKYGPSNYGGGGSLSPDKSLFFYNGMGFALNWTAGTSELENSTDGTRITSSDPADANALFGDYTPADYAFVNNGKTYLTNAYSDGMGNIGGGNILVINKYENKTSTPVAAFGIVNRAIGTGQAGATLNDDGSANTKLGTLLLTPAFKALSPDGQIAPLTFNWGGQKNFLWFLWSDANSNGKIDAAEVQLRYGDLLQGISLTKDFGIQMPNIGEPYGSQAPLTQYRLLPTSISAAGVPMYSFSALDSAMIPSELQKGAVHSSYIAGDGTAITNPWGDRGSHPIGGSKNGQMTWFYPATHWMIQSSQTAPMPQHGGEIVGTLKIAGMPFVIPGTSIEAFGIHSNKGYISLLTTDGMYVAQLLKDTRLGNWGGSFGVTPRNTVLDIASASEECFGLHFSTCADGKLYIIGGSGCLSMVRVDGLETVQKAAPATVQITQVQLDSAAAWNARQGLPVAAGACAMSVSLTGAEPVIDGIANDPAYSSWVTLESSGASTTKVALALTNSKMFGAYKTTRAGFLTNTGNLGDTSLFKTGGCIDLMFRTNLTGYQTNTSLLAGDLRLIITTVNGVKKAMVYEPAGTGATYNFYTIACGNTSFNGIYNVSSSLALAQTTVGDTTTIEFSIPFSAAHFKTTTGGATSMAAVKAGDSVRATAGFIAAVGGTPVNRIYNCYSDGLVSDISCESRMTPDRWGMWKFTGATPLMPTRLTPQKNFMVEQNAGKLWFQNPTGQAMTLTVFSTNGRMIAEKNILPNAGYSLKFSEMSQGTYLYSVRMKNENVTSGKFVAIK